MDSGRRRESTRTVCRVGGVVPAMVVAAGLAVSAVGVWVAPARAQLMNPGNQVNPVYVDDSPFATDSLVRVREHISAGNFDEAVRVLQVLLDNHGESVHQSAKDPNLYISVRETVHNVLLDNAKLLERYRDTYSVRGERAAAQGAWEDLEESLLLTPSGCIAALQLAQQAIGDARFEAANLILDEIERHPDRASSNEAAGLAIQLARYLDRPEVRERATRWADAAKVAAAGGVEPLRWPDGVRQGVVSPLTRGVAAQPGEMVSKPLWSAPVTANPMQGEAPTFNPRGGQSQQGTQIPPLARELLIMPSVVGDSVFVSDGTMVSSWDRFTLAPRWSVSPGVADAPQRDAGVRGDRRKFQGFGMGMGGRGEDLCTVAVQGRTLITATGRANSGARTDGDDRVHGLDTSNGRLKWTVRIDGLDDTLEEATVRGPIQVAEGVAVVPARKYLPDRRLVSLSLIGLETATGAKRWVRPVGSAGSMPWVLQSMGADGSTIDGGVVYRGDRLGVIGAIEVNSGRPRWVRLVPVDTGSGSEQPMAWQLQRPIIDGDTIVLIAPDMRTLLRLDRRSGAIRGRRDMSELAGVQPRYLLRSGDTLVLVGDERIGVLPIAGFEHERMQESKMISPPGIRGRVVLAGDELVIPTVSGAVIMKVADPSVVRHIVLDEIGNMLPLESQLVVADDARLHSYLVWEVAEKLLTSRIEADAKDPSPAVTFAELAYRAGHPDRIAGAVRQAMGALKLAPQNDSTWRARERLINAMQGMLATAMEPGATPAKPGSQKPITDRAQLEELVTLLGEVSFQPEDRLAHAMAAGRLSELNEQFVKAAALYQGVLNDPTLAGATWRGPQVSIRGEIEAARRIEGLLKQHGEAVYAVQEAAAQSELAALGAEPTTQQLEQLAGKYPLAQITPGIWAKVADTHVAAKREQNASAALESGLRSAMRQPSPPAQVTGDLAGRLIVGMRGRQQLAAAAGILRSVRQRFPTLVLTAGGQTLDADKLGAELAERLAASMRWPRIGPLRTEGAQAIAGWMLMDPLLSERTPQVVNLLALESEDAVSVWGPAAEGAGTTQPMSKQWSKALGDGGEGKLVKLTSESAYFAFVRDGDGTIEKVTASGDKGFASRWASPKFSELFERNDSRGLRRVRGVMSDRLSTPAEGDVNPTNMIVAMDDRTMVLVQRTGRTAAIDTDTGEVLWKSRSGVGRVYDVDIAAGTLVVAGDSEVIGPNGAVVDLRPVIQVIDARTGRPLQRIGDVGGHVRWVGFAESGALVACLDAAVVCIDIATGQTNWTITSPDIMPATAMWLFGDHAVLLDPNRTMWQASIATGRLRQAPLEVPRTHVEATVAIDAFPLSSAQGSAFAIATQQGLAIFGPDGALAGVDGMDGSTSMIKPRPADGRAVTIETVAEGRSGDGLMMFSLHALDVQPGSGATLVDSRPILLGARPTAMALMDGRVAVTAGSVTVVLQAPVNK